jgi:hypothetical protein
MGDDLFQYAASRRPEPPLDDDATPLQRFERFHRENPHIFRLFKRFVGEAFSAGMRRIGARFIMERVRWEVAVGTRGAGQHPETGEELKINDHYTPFYVRLYVKEHPEHRERFEMRRSYADALLEKRHGG